MSFWRGLSIAHTHNLLETLCIYRITPHTIQAFRQKIRLTDKEQPQHPLLMAGQIKYSAKIRR